ncbi:MAG: metal ABC transporter substrate-binding protein [FCB group bacterium]|jgi:zinc transport system substrate-binding protein
MNIKFLLFSLFIITNYFNSFAKPLFVTTSYPIASIIKEITGNYADVVSLVPPGASPHTFAPIPSDVAKAQTASAFFYVSPELDGWAANLPTNNKIKIMDILPMEFHQYFKGENSNSNLNTNDKVEDPHFWTDPITVKALIRKLTEMLVKYDKPNEKTYYENAQIFDKRLELFNWQIEKILDPKKGKPVFLFHPSFLYFLKRYGLVFGGVVEVDPGVEPSSRHTYELVKNIKKSGINVIFAEPQSPLSSARVIAESAGVKLDILDDLGGIQGRLNYFDLIMYNVKVLQKELK